MNVVVYKLCVRRFIPFVRSSVKYGPVRRMSVYAFAMGSMVLPSPSFILSQKRSIMEEKEIACPLHSYHEPIRNQVEKMKEMERPKSLVQYVLIGIRKIGSFFHLAFRAVYHLTLFAPVILTSWVLFFPKMRSKWYDILVVTLQICGATFVKLGQWAATRPDILPLDLCRKLSKLYTATAQVEFEKMRKTIEQELGKKIEDVFDEVDPTPLGSGCIAQVYKARLKDSDDWVVLKVKRPEVDGLFQGDLKLLSFMARILSTIPCMEYMKLKESIDIFTNMMYQQLDLRIEAVNLVNFRENFRDDDQFVFPYPYLNLTTASLLVESYEEGVPLTSLMDHPSSKNSDIAHLGFLGFLHMLLVDNFLHADLHPGNILVRENVPCQIPLTQSICHRSFGSKESHSQLVFLDTGLVNKLEESQKRNFVDIFIALAHGDGHEAGRLLIERAPQPSPPVIDPEGFMKDIEDLVNDNMDNGVFNLANLEIANALTRMMSSSLTHHVTLDCRFVNLFMSVVILEGVGRQLDKNLNIIAAALPVMRYAIPQYGEATMSAIKENHSALSSMQMALKTILKSWRTVVQRRRIETSSETEEGGQYIKEFLRIESSAEKCNDSGMSFLTSLYDKVEREEKGKN